MTKRWKQLTPPAVLAVPIAVAKKHCRVVDVATIATQANVAFGSANAQLLLIAKLAGSVGNQYTAEVLVSGVNTPLSVALVDTKITIRLATNGSSVATSTVNSVITAIYNNVDVVNILDATSGVGDGSGVMAAVSLTPFASGLDSGDEDGYLELLIAAATEVIEARTGRAFISRACRMFMDDWGECDEEDEDEIYLPLSPVSTVTALSYYDLTTGLATDGITLFQQDLEDPDLPPRLEPVYGTVLPSLANRVNAVSIDFTAGYGDSPNDIPPRIQQCILFLVAHWFSTREPVISGTATLANKIPFTFETTLNSFRLITV